MNDWFPDLQGVGLEVRETVVSGNSRPVVVTQESSRKPTFNPHFVETQIAMAAVAYGGMTSGRMKT